MYRIHRASFEQARPRVRGLLVTGLYLEKGVVDLCRALPRGAGARERHRG